MFQNYKSLLIFIYFFFKSQIMFSFTWNLWYGIKITNTNGYSPMNMRVNMTWTWIIQIKTWVIRCPILNILNCVLQYPCSFIHRVVQERETEEEVNLKMVRIQMTNAFKKCSTHTVHQKTKLGFEKIQNLSIKQSMGNHTPQPILIFVQSVWTIGTTEDPNILSSLPLYFQSSSPTSSFLLNECNIKIEPRTEGLFEFDKY